MGKTKEKKKDSEFTFGFVQIQGGYCAWFAQIESRLANVAPVHNSKEP